TNLIEIPGGDGALDLTTALAGRPLYKNRTGSIEFFVENDFRDWAVLYSEIMVYLHGQKMRTPPLAEGAAVLAYQRLSAF
ncbi:MAG: hypothetical protein RSA55_05520, partial [Clostridia bacterium]